MDINQKIFLQWWSHDSRYKNRENDINNEDQSNLFGYNYENHLLKFMSLDIYYNKYKDNFYQC